MGRYVDGYVLPVPKKKVKEYQKMAQAAGKIWMKHGALQYVECAGEEMRSKWGMVPFTKSARAKPNETVVFAFVIFKSKTHRNSVNAKVMMDPAMNEWKDIPMPFDMKRMVYGGFTTLVDL